MAERAADNSGAAPPPAAKLRAVIADDDPLARRVVRDTLQSAGIAVAADVTTGVEAVEMALHYKPDVIVMDVVMPELDGVSAARRIHEHLPEVKIVMLSMTQDEEMALLALRSGACGYLNKELDMARLPQILKGVVAGEAAITRRFTARLIEELRRTPERGAGMRPVRSNLTDREWEVLDLISQGRTLDEIASDLVLSAETIRSHEKSLRRKLGVRSRAELAATVDGLRRPGGGETA